MHSQTFDFGAIWIMVPIHEFLNKIFTIAG